MLNESPSPESFSNDSGPEKASELDMQVQAERKESRELEFLKEVIESVILDRGYKINEGNNAYIFSIPADDVFLQDLIKSFDESGDFSSQLGDEPVVAKLLKVYTNSAAKREAQMQFRAREILKDSSVWDKVRVPAVLRLPDHKIGFSDDSVDRLRAKGANFSKETEFMLMDQIDGEDLATWTYKKAIVKVHDQESDLGRNEEVSSKNRILISAIDYKLVNFVGGQDKDLTSKMIRAAGSLRSTYRMEPLKCLESWPNQEFKEKFIDFFDIRKEVEGLADLESFSLPDYVENTRDIGLLETFIAYQHQINESDKEKRSVVFRKAITDTVGYQKALPTELFETMREAVKMLHDQGFYHRDLHERNIMIGGDGRLYLIDFANSDEGLTTNPYVIDANENYVKDEDALNRKSLLFALTSGPENRP